MRSSRMPPPSYIPEAKKRSRPAIGRQNLANRELRRRQGNRAAASGSGVVTRRVELCVPSSDFIFTVSIDGWRSLPARDGEDMRMEVVQSDVVQREGRNMEDVESLFARMSIQTRMNTDVDMDKVVEEEEDEDEVMEE